MSKRKSRNKVDNPKPANDAPGPVRAYVDAIRAQCDRILSAAKATNLDDRCRQWNAAVSDPQCKLEIQQQFGRALATTQLLPPKVRERWSRRLGDLAHGHEELRRRADTFGVLAQRFVESGRPLVTFLLTRTLAKTPPEIDAALGDFEIWEEQHRKLINAAVVELAILEEGTCRIRWDKKTRELWYRSSLVKQFTQTAVTNQETLLDAFHEAQWDRTIENPFSKRQLNETLRDLNKGVSHSGFRFRALGNGRVQWPEETPSTALR
jgi:hypothetical protein